MAYFYRVTMVVILFFVAARASQAQTSWTGTTSTSWQDSHNWSNLTINSNGTISQGK